MQKKGKKFYLTENAKTELEILKRQTGESYSNIVCKCIIAYSRQSESPKEEVIVSQDNTVLEEKLDLLLQQVSKISDKKIIKYLEAMWKGLRITDLADDISTLSALENFKSSLNANNFNK